LTAAKAPNSLIRKGLPAQTGAAAVELRVKAEPDRSDYQAELAASFSKLGDLYQALASLTAIAVPVRVGEQAIGAINFGLAEQRRFQSLNRHALCAPAARPGRRDFQRGGEFAARMTARRSGRRTEDKP
jgi:hypothetical protein